jgi:hypothetical protein
VNTLVVSFFVRALKLLRSLFCGKSRAEQGSRFQDAESLPRPGSGSKEYEQCGSQVAISCLQNENREESLSWRETGESETEQPTANRHSGCESGRAKPLRDRIHAASTMLLRADA